MCFFNKPHNVCRVKSNNNDSVHANAHYNEVRIRVEYHWSLNEFLHTKFNMSHYFQLKYIFLWNYTNFIIKNWLKSKYIWFYWSQCCPQRIESQVYTFYVYENKKLQARHGIICVTFRDTIENLTDLCVR